MKQFVQLIITVLFTSLLFSCKKNYPPRVVMQENQRSKEEKETLQPNEMLENEGLRFNIDFPPGTAKLVFRLYKASPNRSEVRLRVIEESREYFVLSKHMDNNTDFIVTVEYANVSTSANFHLTVNGILSLKGPGSE